MTRYVVRAIWFGLFLLGCGCGDSPATSFGGGGGQGAYRNIEFKDDVKANAKIAPGSLDLVFKDAKGGQVDLTHYRGKKHLVLVFTRGFPGYVCPHCSTLTSRLIANYPEFTKRGAEVVVVFPGPADHLPDWLAKTQELADKKEVPFPLVLDQDFAVVDRLGIRGELAKPSTYIVDKKGQIRFAYVGASVADRPSVKAILQQLDEVNKN